MRRFLGISIAVIIILGSLGIYQLYFYTFAGVTNRPLPKAQLKQLKSQGFQVQPITRQPDDHFVNEYFVGNLTAPIMKFYRSRIRDIVLVNASEKFNSKYVSIDVPNDPHVKANDGTWRDIPCYLVTISPVTLVGYSGGGKGMAPFPPGVEIWVDATTGKVIEETSEG